MDSTGKSSDSASLHLGTYDANGNPLALTGSTGSELRELPEGAVIVDLDEQRAAHDAAYEQPDKSDWVTCMLGPKGTDPMDEHFCHWADDGSDPKSGHMTPKAVHVDGCPHAGSRYVNFVATPVD